MEVREDPYEYSPFRRKFDPQKLNDEAEYIDASPKEGSTELPILYSPGWGVDSAVLRPIAASFVRQGRRTVAVGAPHGIATADGRGLTMPEARKVESILEVMRQRGLEQVDAVAHSESGLALTAAALRHPEKFRTIILINSGGLIENDTPLRVAARTVTDAVIDFAGRVKRTLFGGYKPGDATRTANLMRLIGLQQPIASVNPRRSLREIDTIGNADIRERLKQLRQKGVRVIVIQTTDDGAFPHTRTDLSPEDYDERVLLPGKHNEIVVDPDPFAEQITQLTRRKDA